MRGTGRWDSAERSPTPRASQSFVSCYGELTGILAVGTLAVCGKHFVFVREGVRRRWEGGAGGGGGERYSVIRIPRECR